MSKIKCQICGVNTCRTENRKRIFMANFPLDEERCKKWIQATGNEDLIYLPIEKLHRKSVCGKHFRPKDFKKKKTQLKRNAVPSLEIAKKPLTEDMFSEFPLHVANNNTTHLDHNYCILPTQETSTTFTVAHQQNVPTIISVCWDSTDETMGTVERAGDDHTSEMESGDEEEVVGGGELTQQLLKGAYTRNEMLAAITNRLHAEALASLPPNVRRRIRGLRSLQKEFVDIEAKFYSEVHALECKYEKLYKPLFEKRAQIVNGSYEPTEEECQNPWRDETEEEELAKAVANTAITDDENKDKPPAIEDAKPAEPPMDPNVKGIPDFWYTIFRNVSMLCEMMQEHDEPILKTLLDIKVQMHEDPIGFTLEFHFAPNDYFTDTILTKQYSMKCKPDDENPLEFEGPEIYSCKGCEINWKKGKNVTVKTIKKKQKHKSRGSVRTVTKSVQADSFFNFFSPPAMPEDPNSTLASDIQALLTADFEIGHYIRERVVSRAVLLYTGEGLDEDDDDDYEEEEEEECSSEESEDDDPPPRRRGGNKKAIKGQAGAENPAECKQQ